MGFDFGHRQRLACDGLAGLVSEVSSTEGDFVLSAVAWHEITGAGKCGILIEHNLCRATLDVSRMQERFLKKYANLMKRTSMIVRLLKFISGVLTLRIAHNKRKRSLEPVLCPYG